MDAARYGRINRLSALMSRWPDLVIANSASGAKFHLAIGYCPRAIQVIPNGIDSDRFRPDETARAAVRSEIGIPAATVVAIHVARVDPMKDHATFLAAIERLPNVIGLLVGQGTESLALPGNVRAFGLRRDVPRFYQAADIVVSSSAFGEGFSNALAEGMATGLVPIATGAGDAADIVGDTGRIVAPRDAMALAQAIAAEASLPEPARRGRGLAARQRIKACYGIERAVEAHARLYRSTLERAAAAAR
jgi:glycosyltransferase involved in cell wall biosynthesis